MKTRLSLLCLALAIFAVNIADAQLAQTFSDQAQQPVFQRFSGDLIGGGLPGRLWFESNLADQGLGYEGTYLTLGGKNRLFEDRLDGRWLIEGEGHFSLKENGGYFMNIGLERVFSIDAANADIAFSVWYDYDNDTPNDLQNSFSQVGVNGAIKKEKWDLIGNGYFPVGVQDYVYGDLTGANCFLGNNIVIIPGVDAALEGFDVTLRLRPEKMRYINGTVDFGGYHYSSDTINAFAGGRLRFGMQFPRGMLLSAEINHDDRFDTTGVLTLGWLFGANESVYGHEYSGVGRDLDQTVRNDHIVRYNQEIVLAIDPATGMPYNVVHVDNTADPAFQDGTAERPYANLIAAQNLSAPGDVILVNPGDGSDRGMDRGIVLQNRQRLWGNGDPFLIPVQNQQFFEICADPSGITPTISNEGGFAVVTLANNNEVVGLNIDATRADFGIWGRSNNGSIRNNEIFNARLDGVRLVDIRGDWNFRNNIFRNNGRDGLLIRNALDTASDFRFINNFATGNVFDGIHIRNYDPASALFLTNETSSNGRHGLFLENYLNTSATGIRIENHIADANTAAGVFLNGGDGNLDILNSTITNNGGAGVLVSNWTNMIPTDRILIGTINDGISTISGNQTFANLGIVLDMTGARSNVFVTNQILSDGVRGVGARASGLGTRLDIDIIDNIEINRNTNDGVRLFAEDSAVINTVIRNTDPTSPLQIIDNAGGDGSGIALIAQGLNGQPPARVNALVNNVEISNILSRIVRPGLPDLIVPTDGIAITSLDNAVVDVTATNSTIGVANQTNGRDTQNGVNMLFANSGNQMINTVVLDNLTINSDVGVNLLTGFETYSDLYISNSTILPNGAQSTAGVRSDNNPFIDGVGSVGVNILATGLATTTGVLNQEYQSSVDNRLSRGVSQGFTPRGFQVITDGVFDNLTRVSIVDNVIQDFTFEGVNAQTFGDAQLLLTLKGNEISNNGAGFNDDNDSDNVFGNQAADGGGVADPNNLLFWDGARIAAFDQSTISARIDANTFRDNFERGLSLNTYGSATINAVMDGNVFFGNDRGEDADNTFPPIATSTTPPALPDSGFFDFEAINNEEFRFRDYESLVLIALDDGALIDLAGMDLPANTVGIFYPGNVGFDVFGNPVALGTANLNLGMSSNSFQLDVDLQDFAVPPGDFRLGLDGVTNGFVGPFFGVTDVPFPFAELNVLAEEGFFAAEGFPSLIH